MSEGALISPEAALLALKAGRTGVWKWDRASNRVWWSEITEELLGVPKGSFEGNFEAYSSAIPPEEFARVSARIQEAITGKSDTFEVSHYTFPINGARRYLQSFGAVLRDQNGEAEGLIGILLDRTREKNEELTAAETLRQLNVVRDLTSDYVYEVDLTGDSPRSRVIAGSFENTTGYDENKLRPEEWSSLIFEEDRGVERAVYEAIEKNVPVVVEYRIHDAWGGMKWLRDRIVPVAQDGVATSVLGIVQDITEKKLLETQLLHSQKMEALAQMAGSVAHDFNNLLTVMVSASGAIRQGNDVAGALSDLDDALSRGSEIAQSLLAFGRRQVAVLRPLELAAALQKARAIVQRAVGNAVTVELETTLDRIFVLAELGQLELILLNLVINARDANPVDDKVIVRLRELSFHFSDASRPPELPPGRYAEIAVIDRGSGIPPSVQARMFEPFYTTKEAGHGTGLGLSTVHGIARSWGGTIRTDSMVGEGTTVSVLIPVPDSLPDNASLAPSYRGGLGGSETILLVEDDHLVRRAALRALREHGYRVREYASAEALLEDDEDVLEHAALLLSDVRLGGLDGITLASSVQTAHPTLQVLLMSGYVEHEAQQELLREGRFSFLPKPFTPEGLVHKVRAVLDGSAQP
jgi:PAS domain S-box-containing protein